MAGYVVNGPGKYVPFHVGDLNVAKKIMGASESKRVVLLQLDGDELEAALNGLNGNPKKMYCTSKDDPKQLLYIGPSLIDAVAAVGDFVKYEQPENKIPKLPHQYPDIYTALPRSMDQQWKFEKYYTADGWWYSIVSFEV